MEWRFFGGWLVCKSVDIMGSKWRVGKLEVGRRRGEEKREEKRGEKRGGEGWGGKSGKMGERACIYIYLCVCVCVCFVHLCKFWVCIVR